MAKAKITQTIEIPKSDGSEQGSAKYSKTSGPRTPADEAIDFFESGFKMGDEPIRVYELTLDPDGGPNKDRQVAYYPRVLCAAQRAVSCPDGAIIA